jgi:prostatic aicd phosphatase
LTDVGKKQAYGLGKLLRKQYGSLVSDQWVANEIEAISSSAERCQQTTQLALAGLYPPVGWSKWNKDLNWQPIPVKIDDQMLRTYATKCPKSDEVWKPVDNAQTEPGKSILAKHTDLVNFVANATGWAPTLSKMADVADNLEQMHSRKLKFPDWVENNPFKKNIFSDILEFAEGPQIGCADDAACRKMMAGDWLDKVVKEMEGKKSNPKYTKKMFVYGTHNEIASSFMQLLGVKQEGLPYNGAFFLEYADATDPPQIRMYYSAPNEHNPDERDTKVVKLCDSGDWCPYTLAKGAGLVPDWKGACGIDECKISSGGRKK